MQDAVEMGTSKRGEAHPNCKLTDEKVLEIYTNKDKQTARQAGVKYDVTRTTIDYIYLGKRKLTDGSTVVEAAKKKKVN
jgi:hypothetical protein